MPSSRREWVKLRVATQDDCWLDFVRTGSGDTPSEKLGSGLSIKPSVRLKISVQAALGGPATRITAVQLTKRAASPRATNVGVLNAGQRASMNLPVGHTTRAPDRSRTAAHTSKGSKGRQES